MPAPVNGIHSGREAWLRVEGRKHGLRTPKCVAHRGLHFGRSCTRASPARAVNADCGVPNAEQGEGEIALGGRAVKGGKGERDWGMDGYTWDVTSQVLKDGFD